MHPNIHMIGTRTAVADGLLAFFGAFWAVMALQQRSSTLTSLLLGIAALVTLGLFAGCVQLWRKARDITDTIDPASAAHRKATSRRFGMVVAIEAVAIAVASIWFGAADHPEFIAPIVGVVVGLHFLPLARLFHRPIYYLTGGLMAILSGIAIIALLAGATLGAPENWSILVGLANALVLWFTAAYTLVAVFRMLPMRESSHRRVA